MSLYRHVLILLSPLLVISTLLFALAPSTLCSRESRAEVEALRHSCAGRWLRAKEIEQLLGYDDKHFAASLGQYSGPSAIEVVLDRTPGGTMDSFEFENLQEYLHREKHRLVLTGRFRLDELDSECVIAHSDGNTYLWRGVPGGLVPVLISCVPGATAKQDVLIIEWTPYAKEPGPVFALRRAPE